MALQKLLVKWRARVDEEKGLIFNQEARRRDLMGVAIKDFRELRVYQMAFEAALLIFNLSRKRPVEERYSLTDQIRRSSRPVCANVAEAWRKRRYVASFISRLSDADTEAGETLVWLEFALKCKYLNESEYKGLIEELVIGKPCLGVHLSMPEIR